MSLYKQLWLAVILLVTMLFVGSLAITSSPARNAMQQHLAMKNADTARALALQLAQQSADTMRPGQSLPAQFDAGFYELIQLKDDGGQVLTLREDAPATSNTPAWFMRLFPLENIPGVAAVYKDGQQPGTLTLRGDTRFAYQQLWQSAQKTAIFFLIAMLIAGLLGSYLLKIILRPLTDISAQAGAIGEKHFSTIPEPAIAEFRPIAAAINNLSLQVNSLMTQQAVQPQNSHRQSHVDKISGLLNRDQFLKVLATDLKQNDTSANGIIGIIRLGGLERLNQVYGRKAADGMLAEMGRALNHTCMQNTGWLAARLNGSDFAILAPRATDPVAVAREAQAALREAPSNRSVNDHITLPGASTAFTRGEAVGDILIRLDGALMAAVAEGESAINIAGKGDIQMMPVREQLTEWRDVFRQAFIEHNFFLTSYPVAGLEGELLHLESPARLQWHDETLTATQFLPWINRLELAGDLDKQVLDLALRQIEADAKPVCINLSQASVADSSFLSWMSEKLSAHATAASMLWMEVQETAAFRHLDNLKKLCARARSHGVSVGIEHIGHRLSDIGQLQGAGLSYLKIDAVFIRGIDQNAANQTLVSTLCTLGHAIDATMIAEGVCNDAEWDTLKELGVDGVTGPGVTARHSGTTSAS